MTEQEVAWELEKAMREGGAEDVAFDTIVGSGPNGALPHARISDRQIREGEPIVIDMGAKYRGYLSDMTRTVWLGEPDERLREVYRVVLQAQRAGREAVRPGAGGQQLDAIAREVITEAGYGEYFGHGLGHGVGLAIHEEPRLGKTSTSVLEANMDVTVEPGIYLPGWGGVRIEDLVVVTDRGADILTKSPKGGID
jgi:Xaa-Pro aminopeptidase